jgi:hypothetical protein
VTVRVINKIALKNHPKVIMQTITLLGIIAEIDKGTNYFSHQTKKAKNTIESFAFLLDSKVKT